MHFDLIDKKLDSFIKYQTVILRTARIDYIILCLIVMILGASIPYFVITEIHHKEITPTIIFALLCIFPGAILIAIFSSFISYLKNKNKEVSFEAGGLICQNKRYSYDSIWFVELLGPYVINLQMRGVVGFRFVLDDVNKNRKILDQIKKIKPDVHIKYHVMGKPFHD